MSLTSGDCIAYVGVSPPVSHVVEGDAHGEGLGAVCGEKVEKHVGRSPLNLGSVTADWYVLREARGEVEPGAAEPIDDGLVAGPRDALLGASCRRRHNEGSLSFCVLNSG